MNFRVGQKVVCVRNEPEGLEAKYSTGRRSSKISVGSIYTIREIDLRAAHLHGTASLRFHEIVNRVQKHTSVGAWELAYPATCFRPLIERKTDIGFAHEILRKVTKRKSVTV